MAESSVPRAETGNNSLKIRTGRHAGFVRIVLEGRDSLISMGKVSQREKDIVVSFQGTSISIEKMKLKLDYRVERGSVIFPRKNREKLRTFSMKNPGRLVIDVFQKKGKPREKAKPRIKKAEKAVEKNETEAQVTAPKETPVGKNDKSATLQSEKPDAEEKIVFQEEGINIPNAEDIEDYIPKEYRVFWKRLKSGNSYGVLKELQLQKPENPESFSAYHYLLGEANSRLKKYFSAIEQFRLAYIYAPDGLLKELALLNRADMYRKLKFFYEARAGYLVFISEFPASGFIQRAHLGLAVSLSKIELFSEAVKHYKKAGLMPEALFGMANALQMLGKVKEAKDAYGRAMLVAKTYPLTSPETYYLIGENLRMLGETAKSRKHLSSIDFGPYKDDAEISLGLIAMKESKTDEAIRKFKMAAGSLDERKKVRALFNLALAYIGKGEYEKAISSLENIRRNHVDSAMYKDTILLLARLYRIEGRFLEAVSLLKELVYGKKPPAETFGELEELMLETSSVSGQEGADEVDFAALWNEIGQWLIDETREDFLLTIAARLRGESKPFLSLSSWLVENASPKGRARAAIDISDYYIRMGNIDMSRQYINVANLSNALSLAEDFRRTKDDILRIEAKISYAEQDYAAAFRKIGKIRAFRKADLDQLGAIISFMDEADSKALKGVIVLYEKKINESEWDADYYIKLADILYANNEKSRSLKYYRMAFRKKPNDEWIVYRLGQGTRMPESRVMFSRLEQGDTLLSRLAKTKLLEMDILNKVKEVY